MLHIYPVHYPICVLPNRAKKTTHAPRLLPSPQPITSGSSPRFFGSIHTPFTWSPAIRLVNEKGKHTCMQEIISLSCPRLQHWILSPCTHIHTQTHTSFSAHAARFRVGLKTEGASERQSRGSEWDYWGRGRGRRTSREGGWGKAGWGGLLRFSTDVWTKGLAKLSGLQPRVFTTLVSITNKSRIGPSLPSPPPPPQLKLPLLPLFFPLSNSALLGTAN